jgi:hypothetical protein
MRGDCRDLRTYRENLVLRELERRASAGSQASGDVMDCGPTTNVVTYERFRETRWRRSGMTDEEWVHKYWFEYDDPLCKDRLQRTYGRDDAEAIRRDEASMRLVARTDFGNDDARTLALAKERFIRQRVAELRQRRERERRVR